MGRVRVGVMPLNKSSDSLLLRSAAADSGESRNDGRCRRHLPAHPVLPGKDVEGPDSAEILYVSNAAYSKPWFDRSDLWRLST